MDDKTKCDGDCKSCPYGCDCCENENKDEE